LLLRNNTTTGEGFTWLRWVLLQCLADWGGPVRWMGAFYPVLE
jgi:hypothetical protein